MIRLDAADRGALLVVARTLEGFLRASTAREVSAAVEAAVVELGGAVVPVDTAGPDTLEFDLSCGAGPARLPFAPPGSRARLRLEQVLPGLIDDARAAVARLTQVGRLFEQAEIDALTGLLNRRATARLLDRLGEGDVVALVDLDCFKQVNDTHGHAAGDEVLATFGRVLRDHGRIEDRYGRLGGDEILCVFPAVSINEAGRALNRLRIAWRQVRPHEVTFSAGVAGVGAAGAGDAVKAADQALYEAKQQGRDTIRLAPASRADAQAAAIDTAAARRVPITTEALLPRLLHLLAQEDSRAATDLILDTVDAGASVPDVITRLLAPAQQEVGRRWQDGEWSVAREHLATAVIDGALSAATLRAERDVAPPPGRGSVVVVCPEGEWHQLPSRMISTLLATAGISVVNLGPSLPTRDLRRAIADGRYEAVALSCTLATSLLAGAETVAVAHEAGVPVVAGGSAFGADGKRAAAIGADAWAADADHAAELLRRWRSAPPRLSSPAVLALQTSLLAALDQESLRRIAVGLLRPWKGVAPDASLGSTIADIEQIVRHLDVALALNDPSILEEHASWLAAIWVAHGRPADHLLATYEAIEAGIGLEQPRAIGLLRNVRRLLVSARVEDETGQARQRDLSQADRQVRCDS